MLNYTYLAKKRDIHSLDVNDLQKFSFLALFELGDHIKQVDTFQLKQIHMSVAGFMLKEFTDECLVLQASDLDGVPEDATVKILSRVFEPRPDQDAYIAVAPIRMNPDDPEHLCYHEKLRLKNPRDDFTFLSAVNKALSQLEARIHYNSILEFEPPVPLSKQKPKVCPYGAKIKSERAALGVLNDVGNRIIPEKSTTLGKNTLGLAEEYEPITKEKLDEFAAFFKLDLKDVTLELIAPDHNKLIRLRDETGFDKEKLAHRMGLPSGYFFDLLEAAPSVPARTMIFVHRQYKNILGLKDKELRFKNLIDEPSTMKFAPSPPPKDASATGKVL